MGARTQVKIEPSNVYLYSHWGSGNILLTVQEAMKKKWRWDDEEYLARIMFCEMIDDIEGETGYGIGSSEHGDLDNIVIVNCETQTITYKESYGDKEPKKWTFNEFIEAQVD